MLKTVALAFGVVLVAVGVLGFVPAGAPAGMLLGIFEIGPVHNVVHLASGVLALLAALGERAARWYVQALGVFYAVIGLAGMSYGDAPLLGLMAHNWADVWLHLAIAVAAFYFGFFHHGYRVGPRVGRV